MCKDDRVIVVRIDREFVGRAPSNGIQTRIDLWNHEPIELLGDALCVSVEASAR
jgi:hypothetical protein